MDGLELESPPPPAPLGAEAELSRALVAHTYTQLPVAGLSSGLASLLFAAVAAADHAGSAPLLWLALQVVVHGFNLALYLAFERGRLDPSSGRARRARRRPPPETAS